MKPARLPWLDAARGAALCAMFVYHLTWDLGFYRLIDPDFPFTPGFKLFGHCIATAFLALAGASLVLARQRADHWSAFWRRLAVLVAAAAVVTLVSLWFSPEAPIYFGILHCIALASLLALPLLAAPLWLLAAVAATLLALPLLVASPWLDGPALQWLGLGIAYPLSEDFRPVFPWAGMLLAGVLATRLWQARAEPVPAGRAGGTLAWMGRHSLAIYLVHQPVLIGFVAAVAGLVQPAGSDAGAAFLGQCQAQCETKGAGIDLCVKACGCIAGQARQDNIWDAVIAGRLTAAQGDQLSAITLQCGKSAQ